jgi:hypothetical protein
MGRRALGLDQLLNLKPGGTRGSSCGPGPSGLGHERGSGLQWGTSIGRDRPYRQGSRSCDRRLHTSRRLWARLPSEPCPRADPRQPISSDAVSHLNRAFATPAARSGLGAPSSLI